MPYYSDELWGVTDPYEVAPENQNSGLLGDAWTGTKIGGASLIKSAGGLFDLVTAPFRDGTGKTATEFIGKDLGLDEYIAKTNREYSPSMQASNREVDKTWADPNSKWYDVAGAYFKHPINNALRFTTETVLPTVAAGGAGGIAGRVAGRAAAEKLAAEAGKRGANYMARKTAYPIYPLKGKAVDDYLKAGAEDYARLRAAQPLYRSAIANAERKAAIAGASAGEGTIAGGLTAANIVEDNLRNGRNPYENIGYGALAGLSTGAVAGVFNGFGGSVEAALFNKSAREGLEAGWKGLAKNTVKEAAEEFSQAPGETITENVATGKPWNQGLTRNLVESAIAGGMMGGTMHVATLRPWAGKQSLLGNANTEPSKATTQSVINQQPSQNINELAQQNIAAAEQAAIQQEQEKQTVAQQVATQNPVAGAIQQQNNPAQQQQAPTPMFPRALTPTDPAEGTVAGIDDKAAMNMQAERAVAPSTDPAVLMPLEHGIASLTGLLNRMKQSQPFVVDIARTLYRAAIEVGNSAMDGGKLATATSRIANVVAQNGNDIAAVAPAMRALAAKYTKQAQSPEYDMYTVAAEWFEQLATSNGQVTEDMLHFQTPEQMRQWIDTTHPSEGFLEAERKRAQQLAAQEEKEKEAARKLKEKEEAERLRQEAAAKRKAEKEAAAKAAQEARNKKRLEREEAKKRAEEERERKRIEREERRKREAEEREERRRKREEEKAAKAGQTQGTSGGTTPTKPVLKKPAKYRMAHITWTGGGNGMPKALRTAFMQRMGQLIKEGKTVSEAEQIAKDELVTPEYKEWAKATGTEITYPDLNWTKEERSAFAAAEQKVKEAKANDDTGTGIAASTKQGLMAAPSEDLAEVKGENIDTNAVSVDGTTVKAYGQGNTSVANEASQDNDDDTEEMSTKGDDSISVGTGATRSNIATGKKGADYFKKTALPQIEKAFAQDGRPDYQIELDTADLQEKLLDEANQKLEDGTWDKTDATEFFAQLQEEYARRTDPNYVTAEAKAEEEAQANAYEAAAFEVYNRFVRAQTTGKTKEGVKQKLLEAAAAMLEDIRSMKVGLVHLQKLVERLSKEGAQQGFDTDASFAKDAFIKAVSAYVKSMPTMLPPTKTGTGVPAQAEEKVEVSAPHIAKRLTSPAPVSKLVGFFNKADRATYIDFTDLKHLECTASGLTSAERTEINENARYIMAASGFADTVGVAVPFWLINKYGPEKLKGILHDDMIQCLSRVLAYYARKGINIPDNVIFIDPSYRVNGHQSLFGTTYSGLGLCMFEPGEGGYTIPSIQNALFNTEGAPLIAYTIDGGAGKLRNITTLGKDNYGSSLVTINQQYEKTMEATIAHELSHVINIASGGSRVVALQTWLDKVYKTKRYLIDYMNDIRRIVNSLYTAGNRAAAETAWNRLITEGFDFGIKTLDEYASLSKADRAFVDDIASYVKYPFDAGADNYAAFSDTQKAVERTLDEICAVVSEYVHTFEETGKRRLPQELHDFYLELRDKIDAPTVGKRFSMATNKYIGAAQNRSDPKYGTIEAYFESAARKDIQYETVFRRALGGGVIQPRIFSVMRGIRTAEEGREANTSRLGAEVQNQRQSALSYATQLRGEKKQRRHELARGSSNNEAGRENTSANNGKNGNGSVSVRREKTTEYALGAEARSAREAVTSGKPGRVKQVVEAVFGTLFEHAYGMLFTHDLIALATKKVPILRKALTAWESANQGMQRLRNEYESESVKTYQEGMSLPEEKRNALQAIMRDMRLKEVWGGIYIEGAFRPRKKTGQTARQAFDEYAKAHKVEDDAMKKRIEALGPEGKAVLVKILTQGVQFTENRNKMAEEDIRDMYKDSLAGATSQAERGSIQKDMESEIKKAQRNIGNTEVPYIPLRRFGDHVVAVKSDTVLGAEQALKDYRATMESKWKTASEDEKRRMRIVEGNLEGKLDELRADPNHYIVEMVNGKLNAITRRDELKEQYKGYNISAVRKREFAKTEVPSWRMMQRVMAAAKEVNESINSKALEDAARAMYVDKLADDNMRARLLKAKKVAGFDERMLEGFLETSKTQANYLAQIRYSGAIQRAMSELRRTVSNMEGDVQYDTARGIENEIIQRNELNMTQLNSQLVEGILRTTSVTMLLTNPAFYVQNMTQPFMMSLPYIAGKHPGAMAHATSLLMSNMKQLAGWTVGDKEGLDKLIKHYDADIQAALKDAIAKGRIDIGIAHDFGNVYKSGNKVMDVAKGVTDKLSNVARNVETINRVATFVTAYQIEKEASKDASKAYQFADDVVYRTHGDYSGFNAPRYFRMNNFMKMATQFRKFQLIQAGMMCKLAWDTFKGGTKEEKAIACRQLMLTMGIHLAMTGLRGTPFIATLMGLMGIFGGGPGDDDDDIIRLAVKDKTTADLLVNGIPTLLGLNLTNKIGARQMFTPLGFWDFNQNKGKQNWYEMVGNAAGPWTASVARLFEGARYISNGDYYKGIENMLPNGVFSTAMKAWRLSEEGFTTRKGDQTIKPEDFGSLELVAAALGIPIAKLADRTRVSGSQYRHREAFGNELNRIKRDFADAVQRHDTAGQRKALRDLEEFNKESTRVGFRKVQSRELYKYLKDRKSREARSVNGVTATRTDQKFLERIK